MSFTIRQIKYFVATAELGQVSQAAMQLNISQSAVTTAIQDLESAINGRLFARTPGGMELTDTGRRFLNHAYTILSAVDEALKVPGLQGTVAGSLSVAATFTVIGYFLPYHLQRLSQLYPQVTVNLHELDREEIEDGLLQNRFDMAVVLTANLMNPELASLTCFSSERRLWVASRHPLLSRQVVDLADVAREPYVMLTVDEAADTAMRYWRKAGLKPDVRLRTSSVEAVRSMVGNGAGVAILSDMIYRPWSLEGKRIETINLRDPVPSMDVGLAWSRQAELTPPMQAFRDYFRQTYLEPAQGGVARARQA